MQGTHWGWAVRWPLAYSCLVSASTGDRLGSIGCRYVAVLFGARISAWLCAPVGCFLLRGL
eukprot:4480724-Pyramimonas_sp.AAC.1